MPATPPTTATSFDEQQRAQLRQVLGHMPYAPAAGYYGGREIPTFTELLAFLERFAEELHLVGERNQKREEEFAEMRRDQVAIGRLLQRAIEAEAAEKAAMEKAEKPDEAGA